MLKKALDTNWNALKSFLLPRHLSVQGARLQEIGQDLLSVASQSEHEFLLLGKRLQEFSSTSRQLSQQAALFLQKLTETGDESVLINIGHLLEDALSLLQSQGENMSSLFHYMEPMSAKLHQVGRLRYDFQKISRLLRILGTSIKIESNRAGKRGHEFMILGEEIDQIWFHLTEKTEDLLGQAARSGNLVDSARQHMAANWKSYQTLILEARQSIPSALAEVEEMFRLSGLAIKKIADCAQEIANESGEIVCSLQLHDITRQQLEHIQTALDEIGERLKTPTSRREAELQASQILSVQRLQLKNAGQEMEQAESRIRMSLLEIAKKLERENEIIFAFSEKASREAGKMRRLEHEVSQLASILKQCKELEEEISQALKPTTQSATQVGEYMKEMEKVGYTINILSLNALIKAAQNLESGQTLEVLAEEIHRQAILSREISEKACLELSNLIEDNKALEEILSLLGEQKSKAASSVHLIKANASELSSMNRAIEDSVSELNQKNSQLASQIMSVAQDIKFGKIFRARADQGEEELAKIQDELQDLIKDNRLPEQVADIIPEHYTMEKEREIHREAILGAPADQPEEELFEQEEELFEQDNVNADGNEDDFGENVELF